MKEDRKIYLTTHSYMDLMALKKEAQRRGYEVESETFAAIMVWKDKEEKEDEQ